MTTMSLPFSTAAELAASLQTPSLDAGWQEMLAEWPGAADQDRQRLLDWVRQQRDDFLAAIAIIDDPDDLRYSAVVRYIELKCRWILLNNQVNYTMVNTGSPPELLMYQAGLSANLLAALEEHVHPEHISAITDFLAEPTAQITPVQSQSGTDAHKKKHR
jgi:glyoxylase-like metal-dependent hydrolase (beta-lactamase superfamily II)